MRRVIPVLLVALALGCDSKGAPIAFRSAAGSTVSALGPIVGAPVGMDAPVPGASGVARRAPAVAFDGTSYLVVWEDERNGVDADVYGARVSATGALLDPHGIPIATGPGAQRAPAVAFDGEQYLVVWEDARSGASDVYGARVSKAGEVLDAGGVPISAAVGDQILPAVSGGRGGFLVAWSDVQGGTARLHAARATGAGALTLGSEFPLSAAAGWQDFAAIGFDGESYLVAWSDGRNGLGPGDTDIYSVRVSAAGAVLEGSEALVSAAPGAQHHPAIAIGPSAALIIWEDERSGMGASDVYGARVGATVLDPDGILVSNSPFQEYSPSVGFDGTGWVVVWSDLGGGSGSQVYGARLSAEGALLDRLAFTPGLYGQERTAIAWGAGSGLVVWGDGHTSKGTEISGTLVDGAGRVLTPNGTPFTSGANTQVAGDVAFDGADYLVVWHDNRSGAGWDVYAARVNASGTVLDAAAIPIATGPGDQVAPTVAFDGTNYLLAWEDRAIGGGDIRAARVTPGGALLDADAVKVSSAPGLQVQPAIACDGSSCLVTWQDQRNGVWDVYGARVSSPQATVLDPGGIPISTAPGWQVGPDVAFDGQSYFVVWTDQRSSVGDIYGARVSTSGVVVDAQGLPLVTVPGGQGGPRISYGRGQYLVAWNDNRSGNNDVYATRVGAAGADPVALDAGGFPVTTAPGHQFLLGIAFDGVNDLVIWEDRGGAAGAVAGLRVSGAGALVDGSPFALATSAKQGLVARIGRGAPGQTLVAYAGWDGSAPADGATRVRAELVTAWAPLRVSRAGTGAGRVVSSPAGIDCGTGCSADFDAPAQVTLSAVANVDSTFQGWSGACSGTGTCTVTMDAAKDVTATFAVTSYALTVRTAGLGKGSVAGDLGIACAPGSSEGCTVQVPKTTPAQLVTLTATPGADSVFASWSGCTSVSGPVCTVAMTSTRTATATFQPATYTVTTRTYGTGKGSVAGDGLTCVSGVCTVSVANTSPAQVVTFTAVPEADSVFASWSGCTSVSGPVCSVAVTGARTVIATFQPATYTVTTRTSGVGKGAVAGDGLTCVSGVCTVSVANTNPAQVVTFTAVPEAGSVFTSWSGCTSASGAVCSVAVTGTKTVTATFGPATYTVTARTTGTGKGSLSGDGLTCASGVCTVSVANTSPAQVVTFTAVPEAGSIFTSWSGCTSVSGAMCSVAVTSAKTVTATFQPATYTVTTRTTGTGKGSVSGDGLTCASGVCTVSVANTNPAQVVTFTAVPEADSVFSSWSGCTSVSGPVCSVAVTGARTVTATFQPATYTVTTRTSGTGKGAVAGDGLTCVSGVCTVSVANTNPAQVVTFTAVPEPDSVFTSWSGCTSVSGPVCTVAVTGTKTITATFGPATYTVTTRTSGIGKGSVAGDGLTCVSGVCTVTVANTNPAQVVTFTAVPDADSVFTSWSGCTSVSGPVCSVAVTSARTVTATFQPATYTVTTRTYGTGKGSVSGDGLTCASGVCTVSVANTNPAQVVTFTAVPEAGSVFTSWSGCTSVSGPVCTVAVTSARTVTATFGPATYTVTTRTYGTGKGSVSGDGLTCASGVCTVSIANTSPAQVVTFTALPEAGSIFTSWSGCTSVSGAVCTVAVTSAKTVTATFQPGS
ncbi:InlB B-repeat-containing protein [Anaeromyxobacter soli]|uniref:InlB B-repeat-containing protein n=1 Tax=Anaeromyxobacter soli TaxID=2922725 RepID=UPI001FAEF946|nr:hypothetical protein [Anaeromyxobacter sp. SG29]